MCSKSEMLRMIERGACCSLWLVLYFHLMSIWSSGPAPKALTGGKKGNQTRQKQRTFWSKIVGAELYNVFFSADPTSPSPSVTFPYQTLNGCMECCYDFVTYLFEKMIKKKPSGLDLAPRCRNTCLPTIVHVALSLPSNRTFFPCVLLGVGKLAFDGTFLMENRVGLDS